MNDSNIASVTEANTFKDVQRSRQLCHVCEDYIARFRPRARAEVNFVKSQPSLATAIERAALARNAEGRKHSHQRRIPPDRLVAFASELKRSASQISNAATFAQLHDLVASAKVEGIGRLAIYDTAARIGWYLGLEPDEVFLHAGTSAGARRLGLDCSGATLRRDQLPPEFAPLTAAEVEDCLCIYFSSEKKARRTANFCDSPAPCSPGPSDCSPRAQTPPHCI